MPQLPIGDIGPCEVTWDYGGATPVIITPHLGKVTTRMADTITDVFIDGQGVAPIEAFFEGATLELEVPMARSTLSQLANTIGYRDMGTLAGNVLTLHNVAGIEMMAHAKQIVIKPMMNVGGCSVAPNPNPNTWILFYKCHPWRDFELGFDRSGQRVHMVKFKIFPNQDTGYEGDYFQEGMAGWGEVFYDDFCGDALDLTEWSTFGTNGGRTIGVSGCVCTIGITNGTNGGWWCNTHNNAPRIYRELTEGVPCRIETKLNNHTVNNGWSIAGITVARLPIGQAAGVPHASWCWGRFRDDDGGYDGIYPMAECAYGSDFLQAAPWNGGGPYWLRVEISTAKVLTFSASTDGLAWTTVAGTVAYNHSPLYVGLACINMTATNPWIARAAPFEYFKIDSYYT